MVKYSAVSSMAFIVQSGGREFVLSVGLEGEAALHHWVGGLQQVPEQMPLRFSFLSIHGGIHVQVVADLELAEEMERELLAARRDAVAYAAAEAAAASARTVGDGDAAEGDAAAGVPTNTHGGDMIGTETNETIALVPPASVLETESRGGPSTSSRNRLRVVSTAIVQDAVATSSAPKAVLHAGDTVEVMDVARDHEGKLRYRVSVSRSDAEGGQCADETTAVGRQHPQAEQCGWVSEEAASGQKLVRGLSKHSKRGQKRIGNLVRGVSSRLLGRTVEHASIPDNQCQEDGADRDGGMGEDLEAELDAIMATPPGDSPEEVVVDMSEAAAAVEACRNEREANNGCCVSLCHELCGWLLALGGIAGTIGTTAVVASAGGPHLLALLLCSAAGFSAWFTWLVFPPIRGFAMRLTALTTFLGFLITSGMLVLLSVDVATNQAASSAGNTSSSDTLAGGLVGVTPSTLLLVWKPLYWLSSLLGVAFTFVVYYLSSGKQLVSQ
eukprot:COSAG02_NODE_241_length_27638_cov_13.101020_7_plen_498_part_00